MIKKILTLILTIIIVVGIITGLVVFVFGKEGVLTKATEGEVEWNKKEVLEEINILMKPIYVEAHKSSVETSTNIEELYNTDTIINKFKENGVVENYIDADGNELEEKYYIKIDSLKGDISQYGIGENGDDKDIFVIEKENYIYVVNYYDDKGEVQSIGPLEITQDI